MNIFSTIRAKIKSYLKTKFDYKIVANRQSKEVIFLCPAREKPTGGIKIIYNHAYLLNYFLPDNIQSKILHPKKPHFSCEWFAHKAAFKRDFRLSSEDFIIIPEVMVNIHFPLIHQLNIKYAIYVQNGYFITKGQPETLKKAYSNASLILSISQDATECIQLVYPEVDEKKLMRVHYSIDHNTFKAKTIKKNIITYMPRKLPKHSALVISFLSSALPFNWQLLPIQHKTEQETAEMLAKSKIFLSFSEFEGCPLPPLEAALSGNYVIGYSGEGGNEYFSPPIFSKIDCGDIQSFVTTILSTIKRLDNDENGFNDDGEKQFEQLKNIFSETSEARDISALSAKIITLMAD